MLLVTGELWGSAIQQSVSNQDVKCSAAVLLGDLFTFLVSPAVIRSGYFVGAAASFGYFDGDLGFKSKAARFDIDALQNFRAKGLVAHLHIGEIEVGQDVGSKGEELIAEVVPKKRTRWGPLP